MPTKAAQQVGPQLNFVNSTIQSCLGRENPNTTSILKETLSCVAFCWRLKVYGNLEKIAKKIASLKVYGNFYHCSFIHNLSSCEIKSLKKIPA